MYPQQQLPQLDMIENFPIQQQEEQELTRTASSRQLVSLPPTTATTTAAKKTNNQESLPVQVRISWAVVVEFSLQFFSYIPLTLRITSTNCNINISIIAHENIG